MNFDDPAVQRMLAVGDSSAETRVVDTGGMILLSNDKEETGRYVNYIDEMEKGIQIFTKNGNMYVCQKIKNWNYYVVSSISFYKLMDSGSDHSADHSKHYYKSTGQENVSAP